MGTNDAKPAPAVVRLLKDIRKLAGSKSGASFDLAAKLLTLKQDAPDAFGRLIAEGGDEHGSAAPGTKGLSRRKIYYLIEVAEQFPLDEQRDRLHRIGWTKLAAVAAHLKRHDGAVDVEPLLALAEANTTRELRALLKAGEAVSRARCVQVHLDPIAYERFAAAMRLNGATSTGSRGLSGMEAALMRLVDTVCPPTGRAAA